MLTSQLSRCSVAYSAATGMQGRGWKPGQLKARLQALVDKHAGVAKRPVFLYDGPPIGPVAAEVENTFNLSNLLRLLWLGLQIGSNAAYGAF
jgi:hypothetical protein